MVKAVSVGENKPKWKKILELLAVSTRLGLTSFGGPVAHLGYFHNEYVRRRKWLDEQSYADLVALCQFLPGPASSQVGIGIGLMRAGVLGGIVSFLGFTLPSVILLMLFAYGLQAFEVTQAGWIKGLKIVAVAIVTQAVLGMGRMLAPDRTRVTIAMCVAVALFVWPTALTQVLCMGVAALAGLWLYRHEELKVETPMAQLFHPKWAILCLSVFLGLLILLPMLNHFFPSTLLAIFDVFYRAGSLVFGGGHVVLPLLEREVVPAGWADKETVLAGYGAAQAVPGPLFTYASYLGTVIAGWVGGLVATVAIFLPAFLLVFGTLPFLDKIKASFQNTRGFARGQCRRRGHFICCFV